MKGKRAFSNDLKTPYPLVDADPHASRVIKYMRGSDYALWAAGAGAAPAAIYAMGKSSSSSLSSKAAKSQAGLLRC